MARSRSGAIASVLRAATSHGSSEDLSRAASATCRCTRSSARESYCSPVPSPKWSRRHPALAPEPTEHCALRKWPLTSRKKGSLEMIDHRPLSALPGADLGWLKARHHFPVNGLPDPVHTPVKA